jgi:ABC-2 type transport system permease protein
MRVYWEIARRAFQRHASYRGEMWGGVFTNTVFGFMLAYIMLAVYRSREDVGGYDVTEAVTYVWTAQALLATVSLMVAWTELSDRIRTGDVAVDLSRPVHPLWLGLAADLGRLVDGRLPARRHQR